MQRCFGIGDAHDLVCRSLCIASYLAACRQYQPAEGRIADLRQAKLAHHELIHCLSKSLKGHTLLLAHPALEDHVTARHQLSDAVANPGQFSVISRGFAHRRRHPVVVLKLCCSKCAHGRLQMVGYSVGGEGSGCQWVTGYWPPKRSWW
ncbi:hypothetical protein D3C76_1061130 [compost metagenome]